MVSALKATSGKSGPGVDGAAGGHYVVGTIGTQERVGKIDTIVANALNAKSTQRLDPSVETFVIPIQEPSSGLTSQGGTGIGEPGDHAPTLNAKNPHGVAVIPLHADAQREGAAVTPSADAEGRVRLRDPGLGIGQDGAPQFTLAATAPHGVAVIPFDTNQITHPENRAKCEPGSPAPTLAKRAAAPAVAFNIYPVSGQGADLAATPTDVSNALSVTALEASTERGTRIVSGAAIRRLLPVECERLMAYPDGYTDIPGAKDGPRYAALGNSIAVSVLAWIFERIAMVDALGEETFPKETT